MALGDETIDQEMAADWAKITEKYAVEPEPESPAPGQTAEETPAVAEEAAPERARDDSGKFVKADPAKALSRGAQADAKPDKVDPAPPVDAKVGATPEGASAPERDVNRPPSTWKPAARAEWEKLPPAIRTEIHRREQDFLEGHKQIRPDADFGKSVREVVAPYRMLIEAEGGTPERAIADLMRTAALFRVGTPQQKLQTIAGIARQFNIDLAPLLQPQVGADGKPVAAPTQPQVLQDPRVDQLLTMMNQREQASLEGTVTNWMNEADAQGNPVRPYLGDVMGQMGALVPQIRQANPSLAHEQVLQQAYEQAIWGNPEIRPLLMNRQAQGASEAERRSDRSPPVELPKHDALDG